MLPDDIPTEITKLTYRTTQALGDAGLPVLSQNQTAEFLAHYWPAIERHVREQVATETRAAHFAEAADLIVASCFTHTPGLQWGWMKCYCDAADELRAVARQADDTTSKEA